MLYLFIGTVIICIIILALFFTANSLVERFTAKTAAYTIINNKMAKTRDEIQLLQLELSHAEDAILRASTGDRFRRQKIVSDLQKAINNKIDELSLDRAKLLTLHD